MFRTTVTKVIVFTTTLLCLLSFAHVGDLTPQNGKEITYYAGDGDFFCSRTAPEDHSEIPQSEVHIAAPRALPEVVVQVLDSTYQQSKTHNEIRAPPAIVSLI